MISLKFNIICAFFLANLVFVNLVELNSIFNVNPNEKVCDKRNNEPFQRHTIVNNLDKALEIGLNKSFHDKFECLQKIFDEKLNEMQNYYKLKLKEQENANASTSLNASVEAKHEKKKDKSHKHKKVEEDDEEKSKSSSKNFLGQTGFIFYSMNQNASITDFKHESFKFVEPVLNQTDASLLESEIEAFNNDMVVLKSIMGNIKKNIKTRMSLLKAIKSNERELNSEQKKSTVLGEVKEKESGKKNAPRQKRDTSEKKDKKKKKSPKAKKSTKKVEDSKTKKNKNKLPKTKVPKQQPKKDEKLTN